MRTHDNDTVQYDYVHACGHARAHGASVCSQKINLPIGVKTARRLKKETDTVFCAVWQDGMSGADCAESQGHVEVIEWLLDTLSLCDELRC